jgi:hypothetical protein
MRSVLVPPVPKPRKKSSPRDRIDLRAEPDWIARVQRQADRLGVPFSAYIRLRTTEALERDEASDPSLKPKPPKP